MFNEILNGKATLEPKPTQDPYREAAIPDVTAPCGECLRKLSPQ